MFINANEQKLGSAPFYVVNQEIAAGQYLRRTLDSYWRALGEGKICVSGAKACLKVELLPLDKVKKGGTRLFQACDIDRIVIRSRLTQSLRLKSMAERSHCVAKGGLNVYKEATEIADYMDEIKGKDMFGDFSRFDKSLPLDILMCYAKTRFNLLPRNQKTSENFNRIMAEQKGQVRSLQLCEGSVFASNRGNLSGQSDTTVINDYSNHFCFVYALYRKLIDQGKDITKISFDQTLQMYRLATLGDDNWSRYDERLGMSFDDLIAYIAELGMTLTDSGKGLYEDETFLSRTVRRCPKSGLVYPALKKTSIERLLHYSKQIDEDYILENFNMCLTEAGLWDEEYYNSIVDDVRTQCKNLDKKFGKLGTRIMSRITIYSYSYIRAYWTAYIKGTGEFPSFSVPETALSVRVEYSAPNSRPLSIKTKSCIIQSERKKRPSVEYTDEYFSA